MTRTTLLVMLAAIVASPDDDAAMSARAAATAATPQGFSCRRCDYDFEYDDHIMINPGSGNKNTSSHGTHDGSYWFGNCLPHGYCGWALNTPLDSLTRQVVRLDARAARNMILRSGADAE
jgi:hypothetical protein